jgi:hypothetical protein
MKIIKTAGYVEAKKGKKKGTTYKGEHFDVNPWAVCTESTGREDKEKYERCIQHVKNKSKSKKKKN